MTNTLAKLQVEQAMINRKMLRELDRQENALVKAIEGIRAQKLALNGQSPKVESTKRKGNILPHGMLTALLVKAIQTANAKGVADVSVDEAFEFVKNSGEIKGRISDVRLRETVHNNLYTNTKRFTNAGKGRFHLTPRKPRAKKGETKPAAPVAPAATVAA